MALRDRRPELRARRDLRVELARARRWAEAVARLAAARSGDARQREPLRLALAATEAAARALEARRPASD